MIANCLGINEAGHLEISGCDTVRLAEQYGTPLYVMSEDEIRSVCRRYVASFAKNYNGNGKPIYASKPLAARRFTASSSARAWTWKWCLAASFTPPFRPACLAAKSISREITNPLGS